MRVIILFATLSLSFACRTSLEELYRDQHRRFCLYVRRGLPGQITRAYFSEYTAELVSYVLRFAPQRKAFGEVCMTEERRRALSRRYNDSAIDGMIAKMVRMDTGMFYLPKSMISDEQLLNLKSQQKEHLKGMWKEIQGELRKPVNEVRLSHLARVPLGKRFFYDPRNNAVCAAYDRLVNDGGNAVAVLYEVLSIAVATRLGGGRGAAEGILKHYLAFAFNGIRCRRKDGDELAMSRLFLPFHRMAMQRVLKIEEEGEAIQAVVRKVYAGWVEVLVKYKAWGCLDVMKFEDGKVKMIDMAEEIFGKNRTRIVRRELRNFSKNGELRPRIQRRYGKQGKLTALLGINALNSYRSGSSCASGSFEWKTGCCPTLCRTTHLLGRGLTMEECCDISTSRHRTERQSAALRELTVVYVEAFGLRPPSAMFVLI